MASQELTNRVDIDRVLYCSLTIPLGQPGLQMKNCTSALNKGARNELMLGGQATIPTRKYVGLLDSPHNFHISTSLVVLEMSGTTPTFLSLTAANGRKRRSNIMLFYLR